MARLNEPMVSTDSLEILRRKFLRQNRDIARTNSTQSLKIRSLENECARLISENLELRSHILRLKTELEGSHAQRVADHALQIKEKMEAQLVEWGAMLASLGHEPMPKNHSPRAAKKPRIQRNSSGRSGSSEWRRRETISSMEDLEAAAAQQGRLPPLWENKTYPRETLNQDEILALRSEAEEDADSPDFGPPVSRFISEDPVKLDLSTLTKLLKPALSESESSGAEDRCSKPTASSKASATTTKTESTVTEESEASQTSSITTTTESAAAVETIPTRQAAKTNLKRKTREEDERERAAMAQPPAPLDIPSKAPVEKTIGTKEKPIGRPIKELPAKKTEGREKSSLGPPRKPLGSKNSNQVIGSPTKKSGKGSTTGKGDKSKPNSKEDSLPNEAAKAKKEPVPLEIPAPSSPIAVGRAEIEPASLSAEPIYLAIPDTPEPSAPTPDIKDTPPPVDISSNGETTRGSRRARAAVSYAEPNLRDKMRRPNTKQLYDAVAGEGKNVRRTSQSHRDEIASNPSSVAKSGCSSISSRKGASSEDKMPSDVCQDVDIMASPLVQKSNRTALVDLPASVTTERKGKDSTTPAQDGVDDMISTESCTNSLKGYRNRKTEASTITDEPDVYDFPQSSPTSSSKESTSEETGKKTRSGRQRSRGMSSVNQEDMEVEKTVQVEKASSKHAASRKRASMAATRETRAGTTSVEDSTADGEDKRGRGPSSRRRSMMI
ncbi:hypothetical protein GGS20DRAFT_538147 [Poronia punctata]|nr:hypothetical protein GGS20DRAFT_538147 [Poronia punctata]